MKVLDIAQAQIGYLEKASNANLDHKTANAGNSNYTKFARDLDASGIYNGRKNGYAWCDMFCDWCFIQAYGEKTALAMTGQPKGGGGAGCTYSAGYYRKMGRFFSTPQVGDQIFFSRDGGKNMYHTGLVEKITADRVHTIEGNTSAKAGVVENGGAVERKSYRLSYSKIAGYGRPDYSMTEEDDMQVEQFINLYRQMCATKKDNDASSWSAPAREWAVAQGLITGNGTDDAGNPNYAWEDLLTKEQLVTVLYRFTQMGEA